MLPKRFDGSYHRARLDRDPRRAAAEARRFPQHGAGDGRVQVEVLVGVHVVEWQARRREGFELRADLRRELAAGGQ